MLISNYYILKKQNVHILTAFNDALNCRPRLLVTAVLVGLTLFLNFDVCKFFGISSDMKMVNLNFR